MWLTHECVNEGQIDQNQMNNNRRVFWLYNYDSNKLCVNHVMAN